MFDILYLLVVLWAVSIARTALFWLYLWQLKEYHIPRFIDHFRTHKGRRIFINVFFIVKLCIFIALFGISQRAFGFLITFWVLMALYAVDIAFMIIRRRVFTPVWTRKTLLLTTLTAFVIAVLTLYLRGNIRIFMVLDVLVPVIVSAVVLCVQPFFVLVRHRILKKAREKISSYKNLIVIGITGSYGKTSTKEFLKTILSQQFVVLATPEHKNSEMGIAQTILNELNDKHQIFIVEMGSYTKGGIKLLCDIVKPNIGIVTGVNEQHLATFGSMENLLSAEGGEELLQSLPPNGTMVFNGDNKYCLDLYKKSKIKKQKLYTVNKNVSADIWAEEISVTKDSLDFVIATKEKHMAHCIVNVLGKHNIQNILGAAAIAMELGMRLETIAASCEHITPDQAGITLKQGIDGIEIIDSSYSANPTGVKADLEHLKTFSGKKVVVMPCLIELGKKSADVHYVLGKKIAEVCDLAIITTKDKFEYLRMGAKSRGMKEGDMISRENPQEIFQKIKEFCSEGDTVLLEGRVPKELIRLLTK